MNAYSDSTSTIKLTGKDKHVEVNGFIRENIEKEDVLLIQVNTEDQFS